MFRRTFQKLRYALQYNRKRNFSQELPCSGEESVTDITGLYLHLVQVMSRNTRGTC